MDNLRAIHDAVRAYLRARGDLPFSLTELATAGYIDEALLICPVHLDRGTNRPASQSRSSNLSDDPLTLYNWEFGGRTRKTDGFLLRELHLRQMAMGLGEWVPIVRCDQHDEGQGQSHLNISLNGAVFRSGEHWEYVFRHIIPFPYLAANVFMRAASIIPLRERIPPRSAAARPDQLDLTSRFNGALSDPWTEGYPDDKAEDLLKMGGAEHVAEHDGVRFDLRGVVQLEGSGAAAVHSRIERLPQEARFPRSMKPIATAAMARRLHLLCGVILKENVGTVAATIRAVTSSGLKLTLELRHGIHLTPDPKFPEGAAASLFWTRERGKCSDYGVLSVSHICWDLGETRKLTSLEFEATESASSPFLLAVTFAA